MYEVDLSSVTLSSEQLSGQVSTRYHTKRMKVLWSFCSTEDIIDILYTANVVKQTNKLIKRIKGRDIGVSRTVCCTANILDILNACDPPYRTIGYPFITIITNTGFLQVPTQEILELFKIQTFIRPLKIKMLLTRSCERLECCSPTGLRVLK